MVATGDSWVIDGYHDNINDPKCKTPEPDPCTDEEEKAAEQMCNEIDEAKSLEECRGIIGESAFQ